MKELEQIEADVVIVLTHASAGEVCPIWECEDDLPTLHAKAQQWALDFTEQQGGGSATYTIHDFRTEE